MKKQQKKKDTNKIPLILGALIGVVIGLFESNYLMQFDSDSILKHYFILIFGLFIAYVMQTILHEAGHLLFGLLTGYQFSSFRIFSFMWSKENGKICLKRHSVPGTAGQCLMKPPALNDGNFPFLLYNLGGIFLNLYTFLCFLLLTFLCIDSPALSVFMLTSALIGLLFALTNGIPYFGILVRNDGHNALTLHKSKAARRAFWLQLTIIEQYSNGIRLKDMPEEWFDIPADQEMQYSTVANMAVLSCNRLMDAHKFEEADALMVHILETESGLSDLHRKSLLCERIYVELITENRWNTVQAMLTNEQKKFMKLMKNSSTVMRIQYAYALLAERDRLSAERIKARFEKICKKAPYSSDVQAERELMELAWEKYLQE